MAVTVAVLATELRLATDASAPPPEPLNGVLSRTLAGVSGHRIRAHPRRCPRGYPGLGRYRGRVSYVHDRPSAPQGERFANPWRNSAGPRQMLSRWIDRRAVAIGGPDQGPEEAPDDAPAPMQPGLPSPPRETRTP